MPTTPSDLTVLTLTHAKGAELKYWIDGMNCEAGKRVLTKAGRVDKLCRKLADYYGLDLSSLPSDAVQAGPPSRDVEIQKRQWGHLRELGEAWKQAPDSFQLCERQGACFPTLWDRKFWAEHMPGSCWTHGTAPAPSSRPVHHALILATHRF
jgi:hypothetical protein